MKYIFLSENAKYVIRCTKKYQCCDVEWVVSHRHHLAPQISHLPFHTLIAPLTNVSTTVDSHTSVTDSGKGASLSQIAGQVVGDNGNVDLLFQQLPCISSLIAVISWVTGTLVWVIGVLA